MNVYLDNAATTPMIPEVVDAMVPYMRDYFGNPSSTHQYGRKTKTAIEQARRRIAVDPHYIRPHIRQQAAAQRCRADPGQFNDFHARQWAL